jgi:multidrug resistance protein, MATE family
MNAEVKKTLKIAWPIMIGLIGQHLFGMLDSIMVARHSTVELAASAFVNNVFVIALVLIFGFSSALSALVAQARGRGEQNTAGLILKHGLTCLLIFSLICMFALEFLNTNIHLFHQTEEVAAASKVFMRLMTWSLLPMAFYVAFRHYSDGLEKTMLPTVILSIGFVINTVLNYCLIYGNWGAPELGLKGAGIATLVARIFMAVSIAIIIFSKSSHKEYIQSFWHGRFSKSLFTQVLKLGTPTAMQMLFEVGLFAGCGVMMGWLGTKTIAAHQVVMSLATISFMFPLSISIATSIRCGEFTGKHDWAAVRRIGRSSIYFTLFMTGAWALLFIFCRQPISYLFTNDPDVVAIASEIFLFAAFFQLFDGTQSVLIGILRGSSDVKVPTIITFVVYWIISAPLAYGLTAFGNMGFRGIWSVLALSLVLSSTLLVARFEWLMNKKTR